MIISELLPQKLSNDIKTIRADDTLLCMAAALGEHNIGALFVLDDAGELAGVVSERDLARAMVAYPDSAATRLVGDVMTREIVTCNTDDSVIDILAMMNRYGVRHVPVFDDGKLYSVLSIRDFNLAYERLESLALTDYLTGLSNRRHFMRLLDQEINRRNRFGSPVSLIMIDIDNFKSVNDTYGHGVGDEVIRALADLLMAECRIYDVVGRLGGEEYAVACPNTTLGGAITVCERMIAAVRRHTVDTSAGVVHFTASFGVCEAEGKVTDSATMLEQADAMLYYAKRSGRDRIAPDRPRGDDSICVA